MMRFLWRSVCPLVDVPRFLPTPELILVDGRLVGYSGAG